MNPYLFSALCILAYMCLLYAISLLKKDNTVADLGWGLGFVLVAWITYSFFSEHRLHQKLVTFLVTVWGVRLASYLTIRHWGKPEDFRYADWRRQWGNTFVWRSFLQVFMLQGLIMFINVLPVIVVNTTPHINKSYSWLYPIATLMGLVGFYFEALGDYQMFIYKQNPHHIGVMNKGLWRYTRHPNYFGEAVQWWAMFLLAIPSGKWYISILAPVTITFLLLRVSGVTLLEKKYDGNTAYDKYKRSTNAFIPWFPKEIKD